MPQLAAVIGYIFETLETYVGFEAAASITTAIYYAAEAAVLYAASRALTKNPNLNSFLDSASARTQMVRQAAGARRIIYGNVKVSGPLLFLQSTGAKNEYLHLVIALATHELQSIDTIYLNDEIVPLDGSGNATGKYAGFVRIKAHLGTAGDAADTDLVTDSGGTWTSSDKLNGIAYLYARLKFDVTMFPSGLPNISAVVKGRKVFDPRTSTTAYSTNAALCIYDYFTDKKFGFGADAAEIDLATIQAAANTCDESVTLADATTENRYTINGTIDTSTTPQSNIDAMLSAMAGRAIYAGGLWFIQCAAYVAPSVALSESDLRGPITIQTKFSRRELVNGVKGLFVTASSNWQPTDFPAVTSHVGAANLVAGKKYTILSVGTTDFTLVGASSSAVGVTFVATGAGTGTGTADLYQGEDGGERLWKDVQLPFTTSTATAQRLAKIELERGRRQIIVKLQCLLTGLKVQCGDTLMLNNTRMGWVNKVFEVTELSFTVFNDADGQPALGVDLTLREVDANVYAWSAEDVALPAAATTTLPNPFSVAAPTGMALTVTSFRQNDGNLVPQLQISWTAPLEQTVQSGGLIRIQYKKHADSNWTEWGTVKGDQVFAFIPLLVLGVVYDVQIRAENILGVPSSWVQVTSFTMTADTTPPPAPSGLVAIVGTGKMVKLTWTKIDKATTPDFEDMYGVYKALHGGTLTLIGRVGSNDFDDVNVSLGTQYDYAVTAFDQSENESAKSSTVTATPSGVATGASVTSPTAATSTGSGTYIAGDGTIFSYLEFSLPGLPAGAVGQYVLYRRNGDTQWLVAGDYVNSGTATGVRITELTPGIAYEVATQAYNSFGDVSSTITATSSPFTAPTKSTAPANPTVFVGHSPSTSYPVPPRFLNGLVQMYAMTLSFTPSISADRQFYEYGFGVTGLQPPGPADPAVPAVGNQIYIYTATLSAQRIWVRTTDTSGNTSAWVDTGIDSNSFIALPAGDMSSQNSSGVQVTGLKVGGSGARQIVAEYHETKVITLAGGAAQEDVSVSISGRGFTTKPDRGECELSGTAITNADREYGVIYNYDNGSNSSTAAWLKVFRYDGGNLAAGNIRVSIDLLEFT